jgi:hypothetical protein
MEARLRHTRAFGKVAITGAGLAVVAALMVAAFMWPMARLEPRDLPIGVAGRTPAISALERSLGNGDDAFDVRRYADEAAAQRAVEKRDVHGAVIASGEGTTLLTASAGSPLVAQLLRQALAPPARTQARVVDVVPADADDPRGQVLGSLLLPLTLLGTVAGLIVAVAIRPGLRQVSGLIGVAVTVAAVAISIGHGWLGVLGGDWWTNGGVVALLALALASLAAGLMALLGIRGFALAGVLMVFVANPFAGVSTAPALLPEWAAVVGQLLPPGAGARLLRSSAFFDGNGGGEALAVLLAWSANGLAAVSLAARLPGRHGAGAVGLFESAEGAKST